MTQQSVAPEAARKALDRVRAEVAKAVVGQDAAVSGLLVALLSGGHVLMEGVPGVAKTLLVRSLAAALSVDTKRVQFTPDLMPGDITGSMVFDSRAGELSFREGPLFTNLLLADEINRTPPKTQSALLEAMEEGQVSADGVSRRLPRPFLVAATQNPVEYEGTYPLPEAQLDRFLLKVVLPVPERDEELQILQRHADGFDPHDIAAAGVRAVAGAADVEAAARAVRTVVVSPEVSGYVVDIARATRVSPSLSLGVSPRGATALLRTSRAWAWLQGADVRDPRRREGAGRGHARAPARAAPRGRAGGRRGGPGAAERRRLGARPAMSLTGRVPLLVLLGVVALVVRPAGGTAAWWVLAVRPAGRRGRPARPASATGSPSPAGPSARSGRGRPPSTDLLVANPGDRRVRGVLRDAWQPSAGATGNRHRLDLAAGDQVLLTTPLAPTRRGDRRTDRVTVRCTGPLGLAARQASREVPGRVRVLPPFHSRKHLPSRLARLRELDGRAAVRVRGQGTEFDSLRDYVLGDDVRSIDWRASARSRNVVVRTWQPERHRRVLLVLDTSRTSAGRVDDVPRLDSAMDAALLLAALASRAGDSVDFLAGDRRVRARVRAGAHRDALVQVVEAMADLEPALVEADWSRLALGGRRARPAAGAGGAADRARAGRRRARAAPRAARAGPPAPGGAGVGARPRARAAGRPRGAPPPRCTTRRRPSRCWPTGPAPPRCSRGWASTSSTRTRTGCRWR